MKQNPTLFESLVVFMFLGLSSFIVLTIFNVIPDHGNNSVAQLYVPENPNEVLMSTGDQNEPELVGEDTPSTNKGTSLSRLGIVAPNCADGIDNDNDNLKDFPIDPGCASSNSIEGVNPTPKVTYAIQQWAGGGADASYNRTSPRSDFDNVLFPWSLSWEQANSMDVNRAKAYLDQMPLKVMFSWTMESFGPSQALFFNDTDNFKDGGGHDITYVDSHGVTQAYRRPWMTNWHSTIKSRWHNFFSNFKIIGGKVDVIVMDAEKGGEIAPFNQTMADLIMADPKFDDIDTNFTTNELARGPMSTKLQGLLPLMTNLASCNAECQDRINFFFRDWFYSYLNKATYDVAKTYFPNAIVSNFNAYRYDYDKYFAPIDTWVKTCANNIPCTDWAILGNTQTRGMMYSMEVRNGFLDPLRPNPQSYFSKIRQDVAQTKVMALSDPNAKLAPLVASSRSIYGSPTHNVPAAWVPPLGTDSEEIFHLLLLGPRFLQTWQDDPIVLSEEERLSLAMKEFDKITNYGTTQTLMFQDTYLNNRLKVTNSSAYSDDAIFTGMKTGNGNRTVWRWTPEPITATSFLPAVTVANSLKSEYPATFETRTHRYVFPQGRVYHPQNPQSNLGYWIVTPTSQQPIITELDNNTPPTVTLIVNQSLELVNYVLFDTSLSSDPDGPIDHWSFDFDGNGTYGDMIHNADGVSMKPVMGPGGALTPNYFFYLYSTPGPHTVGVRLRDEDGAVTEAHATFTAPSQTCASSTLFYTGQCVLVTVTQGP